jgi:hypothetical protein
MVSYAHAATTGGARVDHARAIVRPVRVDAGLGVHDLARFEIDDGNRATERRIAPLMTLLGGVREVATVGSYTRVREDAFIRAERVHSLKLKRRRLTRRTIRSLLRTIPGRRPDRGQHSDQNEHVNPCSRQFVDTIMS